MSAFCSALKWMLGGPFMAISTCIGAVAPFDIQIILDGTVFAETCTVEDVTVDFGQHSTQELNEEGGTGKQPVTIKISGCPPILKTIDMKFGDKSQAAPEDESSFSNSERKGDAKNVSIVVIDKERRRIWPGNTRKFALNDSGGAVKNFKARIISPNKNATAGKVAVTVPLIFIYP